jgi:proteasome lid subunit RPN8/RPN11
MRGQPTRMNAEETAPETESNVRLLPAVDTTPLRTKIPLAGARRWISPHDGDRSAVVSVFVTPHAFVRFCAHAGSDPDQEVGGGLVGGWHTDESAGRSFIIVQSAIPAKHTRQGSAFLTFTQDTLVAMNDELEERFPGKQLVGWFHTHPRMGVFLSKYDVWLHRHFFPEAWQVALVIEPHSATGGFFIRQQDGSLDVHRYFGFYELIREGDPSVVHWRNLDFEDAVVETGGQGNE